MGCEKHSTKDVREHQRKVIEGYCSEKLRSRFGIKGKALSWLQSYLTDRSQSVQIDGFTSSVRP